MDQEDLGWRPRGSLPQQACGADSGGIEDQEITGGDDLDDIGECAIGGR
jgi:hypothetical protein